MAITGNCLKCKEPKDLVNSEEVTMKNGRKAIKGDCPDCNRGIMRFGGLKEGETL